MASKYFSDEELQCHGNSCCDGGVSAGYDWEEGSADSDY